ncbi:MAG: RNA polymerase sigma factor [Opitutaceae bacterium]|nr:RNA polymerase sigma factor [Opitutaceae bacterium]
MPPEFQLLVERYYETLYRFGYSLAGNRTDACDLVQQTFLIWARSGSNLRDAAKAKSWLFTTLYREFLKLHRHTRRMNAVEPPTLEAEPVDADPGLLSGLDGEAALRALAGVDEVFRAPLALFYLEELSYKDIARALDIPIGTVMSRISRGKDQLRSILQQRTRAGSAGAPSPTPTQRPAHHG